MFKETLPVGQVFSLLQNKTSEIFVSTEEMCMSYADFLKDFSDKKTMCSGVVSDFDKKEILLFVTDFRK